MQHLSKFSSLSWLLLEYYKNTPYLIVPKGCTTKSSLEPLICFSVFPVSPMWTASLIY